LMTGLNVAVCHHHDCRSHHGRSVVGGLASDENTISDLKILRLDRCGVLEVFFAGRDTEKPRGRLNGDTNIWTRVRTQHDRGSVDRFYYPDVAGSGRLSCWWQALLAAHYPAREGRQYEHGDCRPR